MASYVKFRKTDKATYDGLSKDNNTIYFMPNDELVALGTHIFYAKGFVDANYNSVNGVITFDLADGDTKTIDLPTEMIFDGEESYYDHETKELVMVFANSSGEVRIDFEDLADKILLKVGELETKLTDGTVQVKNAEVAIKDNNNQVIHETYATISSLDEITNTINEELDRLEDIKSDINYVEQRIQDLAAIHGLEDDNLTPTPLEVDDTIENSVIEPNVFLMAHVTVDNVNETKLIQPNKYAVDDYIEFEIGDGEIGDRETAQLTKTDSDTWTFTSSLETAEMEITGYKIKEINELVVDNQDENRTDMLSFAIIDGKLAYKIKEGE